jgi:protein-tyrosine kinase
MSHSSVEGSVLDRNVPELLPRLPPRLAAGSRLHGLAPGELVKLHHSLAESLDCAHGIIAQFVAPEPDATIESVVYDLAYVSAAWLDKRVLFVNGTGMRFDMKEHTAARRREPIPAREFDLADIESSITRVVGLELYQMTFPSMLGALNLAPALRRMPEFLDRLRDTFDLVVIASPPASDAPMGVLLSRFVDGNILVLESGRTRAPVATELRDSLSASGGAVVGAVLTRYRSPIPRFLRRWL